MISFAILPVIAAALVCLSVSIIWFSPTFFGGMWARDLNIKSDVLELNSIKSIQRLVVLGILFLLVTAVLAQVFSVVQASLVVGMQTVAVFGVVSLLLFGIFAVLAQLRVRIFLVASCYFLSMLFVSTIILVQWPW